MTGKLVKRGLIVLQDYSVPVLMRSRIEQVMRKEFSVVPADAEVKSVVQHFSPEGTGALPVVTEDGRLSGIIEPHDLLRGLEDDKRVSEVARQNYVLAYVGDTVDQVTRRMLRNDAEHVIVLDRDGATKPIGIVRAADILRLRRWVMEEEEAHPVRPGK